MRPTVATPLRHRWIPLSPAELFPVVAALASTRGSGSSAGADDYPIRLRPRDRQLNDGAEPFALDVCHGAGNLVLPCGLSGPRNARFIRKMM